VDAASNTVRAQDARRSRGGPPDIASRGATVRRPPAFRAASLLLCASCSLAAWAQQAEAPANPLEFRRGDLTYTFSLGAASSIVGQRGAWWNLAAGQPANAGFDTERGWMELHVTPGVSFRYGEESSLQLYGALSAVASGTLNEDLFAEGDTGRFGLESAHVGVRRVTASGTRFDLSLGAQPYRIGTGMLIHNGAGNGFERGALTLAPRSAWGRTALGRIEHGKLRFDAFFLAPNDLDSADTATEMAGARAEWTFAPGKFVGLAYVDVLDSTLPYVQAPLRLVDAGRDGTRSWHGYVRWAPTPVSSVRLEYVDQRNGRIGLDADALNVEAGYTFASARFMPTLTYSYRRYSGDDPSTPGLEKFDPLYWDGGVSTSAFATGGNASFAFFNSNVVSHRLALDLVLSQRDFMSLKYWHVEADETDSPVQFGQLARLDFAQGVPSLLAGVPDPALSDDLYVEYTRVLNPKLFLTLGAAASLPGRGLERASPAPVTTWYGVIVNVTTRF
jgi:hypothetical protein